MKTATIRRREHALLCATALTILLCVGGCVTTRTVGDFAVSGTVVDTTTGKPLEGAEVVLHYYAQSNFKVDHKYTVPVVTDSDGKFYIEPQKIRLWGGIGPLSGYIKEFPGVQYRMEGYCEGSKAFMNPSLEKYRDMRLELRPDTDGACG
jgi:hypothetical protein